MKELIRMAIFVLALSGSLAALADDDPDAERAVLRETLDVVETALNDKAFDRVVPLLDDSVVIVFLNGEVTRGIEQARTYFDKTLGSTNPILSSYHTKASVGAPARIIGNIAVADGSTKDTLEFVNGSTMVVDSKWTVTLEKRGSNWKILQLQFSSNLFNNPLVNSAKNKLVSFTIIAALAGLIIGFIAARKRKVNA